MIPDQAWRTDRPAPRRLKAAVWILAAAVTIGSTLFVRMLMLSQSWTVAAGVGLVLGLLLILFAPRRAIAAVDARGVLVYGWGNRLNLSVHLSQITGWRMVSTGLLVGVGARVNPQDVTFFHRKGLSYRKMRQYDQGLGTALVLEFLNRDDLGVLLQMQKRVCGAAAPLMESEL
jgi:hypothetical protein